MPDDDGLDAQETSNRRDGATGGRDRSGGRRRDRRIALAATNSGGDTGEPGDTGASYAGNPGTAPAPGGRHARAGRTGPVTSLAQHRGTEVASTVRGQPWGGVEAPTS